MRSEKTLKGRHIMKRTLRIEQNDKNVDFDYDKLRAYYFETQCDGSIAFVIYPIDGGRYVFPNNENLKIQLIEEKDEN